MPKKKSATKSATKRKVVDRVDSCSLVVNTTTVVNGVIPINCDCQGQGMYVKELKWDTFGHDKNGIYALLSGQPNGQGGTTPIRVWPEETDAIKKAYYDFLTTAKEKQLPIFFVTAWPGKLEWICKIGQLYAVSSVLPPCPVP